MLFRSTLLAVAATLAAIVDADYTIDPDSVSLSIRQSWCVSEKQTCPFICQQMQPATTLINECDAEDLTYSCVCGDNKKPNVSEFSLSLPYFVCREWGNQCVQNCKNDNICEAACRQEHPCGATDPKRNNASTTVNPTASQTDGSDTLYTGVPGLSDNGKKGAAAALEIGKRYSMGVVLATMFVAFVSL